MAFEANRSCGTLLVIMISVRSVVLAVIVCLAGAGAVFAQTFQPKSIHFKGAEGYSDQELLSAIALQPGTTLSQADVNSRTQKLMDTGLFSGISYRFDGVDLIFQVTPSAQLYPFRLENLPLVPGPELDAKIREKSPLYRGKVPSEGVALDEVRAALEQILKAQAIDATIQATPFAASGQGTATAISFTIVSPQVLIGEVQPDGVELDPDAAKVLAGIAGSAYDREHSAEAIKRGVGEVYHSKGYLDADVEAAQLANLSVGPVGVRIPFRLAVKAGPLFKVAAIQLAPDMFVSQADFDKQSHTRPGDAASAEHIAENWHFIERQYHNRGYMRAKVAPVATLDHGAATVSYAVSATPGQVFNMGKLKFEGVSDDLRDAMLKAWKMPEGSLFNEGAILGFFATNSQNPLLEKVFARVKVKYVLQINDEARTVDTTIRLERRS